jgi:hypothetical protein
MRLYETAEELGFQRGPPSLYYELSQVRLTIYKGGHLFLGYILQYLLSVALYLQFLFGRPLECSSSKGLPYQSGATSSLTSFAMSHLSLISLPFSFFSQNHLNLVQPINGMLTIAVCPNVVTPILGHPPASNDIDHIVSYPGIN